MIITAIEQRFQTDLTPLLLCLYHFSTTFLPPAPQKLQVLQIDSIVYFVIQKSNNQALKIIIKI